MACQLVTERGKVNQSKKTDENVVQQNDRYGGRKEEVQEVVQKTIDKVDKKLDEKIRFFSFFNGRRNEIRSSKKIYDNEVQKMDEKIGN